MACNPATLISDAKCYLCIPESLRLAMALRLMCAIRDGETTVTCSPETLLADAKCIACKIPEPMLSAAMLPVLCSIVDTNAARGGGVSCQNGAPVNPPTDQTLCAFSIDRLTDSVYYWNSDALEWRKLLGS